MITHKMILPARMPIKTSALTLVFCRVLEEQSRDFADYLQRNEADHLDFNPQLNPALRDAYTLDIRARTFNLSDSACLEISKLHARFTLYTLSEIFFALAVFLEHDLDTTFKWKYRKYFVE